MSTCILELHHKNLIHGSLRPSQFFIMGEQLQVIYNGVEKYFIGQQHSKQKDIAVLKHILLTLLKWQGNVEDREMQQQILRLISTVEHASDIHEIIHAIDTSLSITSSSQKIDVISLGSDASEHTQIYSAMNQTNASIQTSPVIVQETSSTKKMSHSGFSLSSKSGIFLQQDDFFAHYRIISKLGEGGMGVVFKVEDTKLQREVALKLVQPREGFENAEIKRFLVEAKVNAQLDHPNIVRLLEVGDEPQNYFTMEFIDGKTLKQVSQTKKWDYKDIAKIFAQISSALKLAHSKHIIHRDIKPSNILIDKKGTAKVMDFGLAKLEGMQTQLSKTGEVMGTPSYMSPEQVNGQKLDHRTDVYSVGASLYEIVTGRPVFQGALDVNIMYQVMSADPILPRQLNPDIPYELEAICLKCLEKNPGRRYDSMEDLLRDLKNFLNGKPILAKPPNVFTQVKKFLLRHKVLSIATCVILFTIVSGGLFSYSQWRSAEKARVEAISQKKIAEKERTEKTAEARASNITLSKIALIKATEVYRSKKWRECGVLAGASLDFVKHLQGKDLRKIRKQARSWIQQAIRQQKLLWVNKLHKDAVICVSTTSKLIVTGSLDNTIKVWSLETGQWLYNFGDGKSKIKALEFSPSGKYLVCAYKNSVVVYDFKSKKKLHSISSLEEALAVTFSPDENKVAFLTNREVFFYDLKTKKKRSFKVTLSWVKFLRFDNAGKNILVVLSEDRLQKWNVETEKTTIVSLKENLLEQVSFQQKGNELVIAYANQTVKILNLNNSGSILLNSYGSNATAVAIGPFSSVVAVAFENNDIHLIDVKSNRLIRKYSSHSAKINQILFTPDGEKLISISNDRSLRCWYVTRLVAVEKQENIKFGRTFFSPNNKWIASASLQAPFKMHVWESSNGKIESTLDFDDWPYYWGFRNNREVLVLQKDHVVLVNWENEKEEKNRVSQSGSCTSNVCQ